MNSQSSAALWPATGDAPPSEPVGQGAVFRRLPRWSLLCLAVAGVFLALALLGDALGGAPSGPVSSSYATGGRGVAAWAELLARSGRRIRQLRVSLGNARLDPADTLIILDPDALLHSEGSRLRAFMMAGGRLVFAASEPERTLPALLERSPSWSASSSTHISANPNSAAGVADVREVSSAGEGQWLSWSSFRVVIPSPEGGALLIERSLGSGRLELLADASPLQNRLLASADNAQFGLDLAGARTRPVVFVESVHGYGQSRGLAALPGAWWLALAGLALAGALWILARGRRLGGPQPAAVAEPPPRMAYTDALTLLLRRTREPAQTAAALERLRDRG